eukprot:4464927-Alexandrium_andersonii.AAC.1
MEQHPGHVLVKLDITNAFGSIDRQKVAESLREALPNDRRIVDLWVATPARHFWYDALSSGTAFE